MPQIDAIRFRKYKSFGEEYSTIPLKRMTVLIGRNNSGKSSCIDVIEAMTYFKSHNRHRVVIQALLTDEETDSLERQKSCGENTDRMELGWYNIIPTVGERSTPFRIEAKSNSDSNISVHCINNKLENIKTAYYRLNADRDICPEEDGRGVFPHPDGTGATSLIQLVLNSEGQDEWLIQRDLLHELNNILYPDITYSNIVVQKLDDKKWEVFLYEGDKRFALSKMGSGLKTIILVLLNLIVIPRIKEFPFYGADVNIFAFEELENNLHPALQRRLFAFIDSFSKKNPNTFVFLSTHSHVPINMFARNKDAQILHVIKDKNGSSLQAVSDFAEKSAVLDDLDVRASDLLQANGIIWVEGPSDRIYIQRWIEIWENELQKNEKTKHPRLEEGADYQFLYYGGKLLSHYTANKSQKTEALISQEFIDILKINRHAAIVIDSDITEIETDINETKKRIRNEFNQIDDLFCWITDGKEIENYLPYQAINEAFECELSQCGQYELFPEYIKIIKPNFKYEKVRFASKLIDHINVENSDSILDLKKQILELIKTVRGWTPDKHSSQT